MEKGFKKGKSGNPNGRPKNSLNKTYLTNLAINDYERFYNVLITNVDRGEPWAMKLFYEHLPKSLKEEGRVIKMDTSSLDAQLESLRKGMGEFEMHTLDSLATTMKALSTAKLAEVEAKKEEVVIDRGKAIESIDKYLEDKFGYKGGEKNVD